MSVCVAGAGHAARATSPGRARPDATRGRRLPSAPFRTRLVRALPRALAGLIREAGENLDAARDNLAELEKFQ